MEERIARARAERRTRKGKQAITVEYESSDLEALWRLCCDPSCDLQPWQALQAILHSYLKSADPHDLLQDHKQMEKDHLLLT
jgi:hypothetical protein